MFIQPIFIVRFTTLLHITAELFTTIDIFDLDDSKGKIVNRGQFFRPFLCITTLRIVNHIPVFYMDANFFLRAQNHDRKRLEKILNLSGEPFLNLGSLGLSPYLLATSFFQMYLKANFFVRIMYTQFGELSSSRSTNFILKWTCVISIISAEYINVAVIEPTCLNYDAILVSNNIVWETVGALIHACVCGYLNQLGLGEGVNLLLLLRLLITPLRDVEYFIGITNTLDISFSLCILIFTYVLSYYQQGIHLRNKIRPLTKPSFVGYINLYVEKFVLRGNTYSTTSLITIGHMTYDCTVDILWFNTYISSLISFITIVSSNLVLVKTSVDPKELSEKITKLGFLLIDYRPGQETIKYLSIKFKVLALANGIFVGVIFVLLDRLSLLDLYSKFVTFITGINTILNIEEKRNQPKRKK